MLSRYLFAVSGLVRYPKEIRYAGWQGKKDTATKTSCVLAAMVVTSRQRFSNRLNRVYASLERGVYFLLERILYVCISLQYNMIVHSSPLKYLSCGY